MSAERELFWRIVQNDLRLWWRGSAAKKAAWVTSGVGRLVLLGLAHLVAWSMLVSWRSAGLDSPGLPCLVLLALLVMAALHRSLEVLYNRGDLSLLLASPVPPRVVLATRLLDVTTTTLLGTAAIVIPVVDCAIVLVGTQHAWAFAAWVAATMAVVPAAILTTVVAVERFGARRARTAIQVGGLAFGVFAMLATQLPTWLRMGRHHAANGASTRSAPNDAMAWLDVPPLRQLVAAASGDWPWLLALAGIGAAAFVAAHRLLAARFVQGAQGAAADAGAAGPRDARTTTDAWRLGFRHAPHRTLLATQFRLLRRDPLLLMRCAVQIVSLVPMLFTAFLVDTATGVGGVAIFAAAVVPMQLGVLRNMGDEANEFEATSPMSRTERALLRTTALALPFAVLGTGTAVFVGARKGLAPAAIVAVSSALNAFATAWAATCTVRIPTAEERARNRPPRIGWQLMVAMLSGGFGTGALGTAIAHQAVAATVLFVLASATAGLLFVLRPRALETDR